MVIINFHLLSLSLSLFKVDMNKVKLEVLKPWISNRIIDLLGMEDDVLVEFVSNQLEAETVRVTELLRLGMNV